MKSKFISQSKYRPEIDGIRAFAVVTVIINHFNKDILPGGYLGVDIFFVISGFVITSSLYQRPSKDFKDFISGFYERRVKRLVPALSVFVLITGIAICLFNPFPGVSLWTGITSLFGLSNLYLLKESTDYFAESTELNVFTHTWSLGVEEQFYILFPFLIWMSGFGRQTKNGTRNLFYIVGTLTIASLVGFLYLYPTNQTAAYFLMTSRFWEMATGCLLFIGFQKQASIKQFLEKVPPFAVLALIVAVMYLPMSMASASTIAIVLLTSILIASLNKQTTAFKVFTNPKVIYIGLISYPLYLWHWGVISLSRWTIGIHWWSIPFQVALILGLAISSYQYIETPFRKGNWFGKRWKTIAVGGGILVMVSSGLGILGKPLKGRFFSGNRSNIIVRTVRSEDWRNNLRLGTSPLTGEKCFAEKSYSELQLRTLYEKCKLPIKRTSKNQTTVLFVGDSHAFSLMGAEEIISENGARVIHYSHGGCPFPTPPYGINPPECKKFNENAEEAIFNDLQSGDYVVIYNYHLSHLSGKNSKDSRHNIFNKFNLIESDSSQKINLYLQGISRIANKANQRNISIILIGSAYRNPDLVWRKEWFRPINFALRTLKEETINAKKLNNKLSDGIQKMQIKNIQFIDPLQVIDKNCGKNIESYTKCFRDENHMQEKPAKELINFILKEISN